MPHKTTVLIASRALSLYLVFWGFGNLVAIPDLIFSMSHYAAIPSVGASYLYRSAIISLTSHLVFSVSLFLAATWCYYCVPRIRAFLSPCEEDLKALDSPSESELS